MLEKLMNRELVRSQPSGIRTFTNMAGEVEDCLLLTIGEPDFNTPDKIKEAAKRALDENDVHYPPWAGQRRLRERIARFELEQNGVTYDPEEIILTDGATEALYLALRGILNEGDEVIVPTPAFALYQSITELSRGTVVPLPTVGPHFQIEKNMLNACLSERTKAIVLNSPNNPTGTVYTQETLEMIRDVLLMRQAEMGMNGVVFVICDDVYAQLSYGEYRSFTQFQELRGQIIGVQSFSKPYAMTGWRAGYLMADREVTSQLVKLHASTVVSAVSFIQQACGTALDCDPAEMREVYRNRRNYVYGRLQEMGLEVSEPRGAFYIFPSIAKYGLGSEEFCLRMVREARLAALPGKYFGADGHIRISYCYCEETLREGMDRLERFLSALALPPQDN
ncbi:pyridoxal phosphate-dependent aminotransferase [Bacilliculturomica massiliensis]|uniref:pyridoxal phosphate-dependent aminotransferase n=1 Tax=Bacilliculturomica massiliensis TaxID=1917867 RepID=UPI001FE6BBFD|nr:aminotransferase class I/II-fold pyridoxal phosphate-dependent enzyme [Bacilliculturomica massiliensis]